MISIKLIMEILEKSVAEYLDQTIQFSFYQAQNTLTNEMIMRRLQSLNQENKNIRISRIGINNSAGFVNSCVMKSGFPGPLNFTDWGINYEPYELELSKVKKRKEVQF